MATTEQDYNEMFENLMGPEEERMAEAEFARDVRDPSGMVGNLTSWGNFLMKNPSIMLNQPTTISTTKNTGRARDALKQFDRWQRTKRHKYFTEAKSPFYAMTVGYGNGQYMKLSPDHMNQLSRAVSHHITNMPTDKNGEMRLYDAKLDATELPFVIASEVPDNESGLKTEIGADFTPNCPEYQELLKKGTLPSMVTGADGVAVSNGFKMSLPVACKLLVQSCMAANGAHETVDFYNGASSKGLQMPVSANASAEMVDQLNAVAADSKNALKAFSPSADLFAHGVLPKHMVGRQVNVYKDLQELCGEVGGIIKKSSIGAKATMDMSDAEIADVKTAITKEIGAAIGSAAAVHNYEDTAVKAFKLYNGNGFYGNDSSVFNADATAVQTGKIGAESIGYNKHDCAHMMVRAEIGDHVVDVPIVPAAKTEAGLYKMRVAAAACTNALDNSNFDHTVLHNVDTHTITSKDGKVLASFY